MKNKLIILFVLIVAFFNSNAQINGKYDGSTIIEGNQSIGSPVCDSISSFPVVDTWPTGVAWDGTYLWSGGSDFDFIFKYDTMGYLIDSIPTPGDEGGTQGLVFDGVNLWTISEQVDRLYQLDIDDGSIINQYSVPFNEDGWGLAYDGEYLYATCYTDSLLAKIDPSNGQIVNSFKTEHPLLGIEFINGFLYGLSLDFVTLHKINAADGSFITSISWCIPYPLGLAWDGTYLWNVSSRISSGGLQRLFKLDVSSFRTTSTKNIAHQDDINLKIFPNPITESGTIQFNSKNDEFVKIDLFDSDGRKVKTIFNQNVSHGDNNIFIDTRELLSGVYWLKYSTKNNNKTIKLVVCKN